MRKTLLRKSIIYIGILLLASCAIERAPQGGPKNETPPEVLNISPPNNATNVLTKQVIITFDEFISLKNINQELVINPYIDSKKIETVIRGKKLIITLPTDLETNTTYNFNFGNSITDIQEYTPLKNFSYIFSTGDIIDSLTVTGSVSLNGSLSIPTNSTIGLYNTSDTVNPATDKPLYYSKAVDGKFSIHNLSNEKYQVYAFTDENNNLLYDSLTEKIGFNPQLLTVKDTDSLRLNIFKEDVTILNFNRPVYKNNYIELNFNKGLQNVITDHEYILTEDNKTLKIYPLLDITSLNLIVSDSLGTSIDTSLVINKAKSIFRDSSMTVTRILDYNPYQAFSGIEISANHKIKEVNTDSITIVLNEDTLKFNDSSIEYKLDKTKNILQFYSNNPEDKLTLILAEQAIKAISGHYSKRASYSFSLKEKRIYGQITGNVITEVPHYILYLIDKKGKIVDRSVNPKQLDYQFVMPGQYSIKVLIDSNNNGRYDTGDLDTKRQPETYFFYIKPIIVKSNWEVGNVDLIID